MVSKSMAKAISALIPLLLLAGCSQFGAFDMSETQLNSMEDGGTSDPGTGAEGLPDDPWADAAAGSRRRVIIDNSGQSETLQEFQLMLRLDDSRIDYSETDGTDLQFFSAGNEAELYYEVESWNENGSSIVWVRVPEIWGESNQNYLWLYWGSGANSVYRDASKVWSEYEGVYHLSQTGGTQVTDSSPKGRDGTVTSSVSVEGANGRIGGGVRLGAVGGYIDVPDYASSFGGTSLSHYTVEVWMKGDAAPANEAPSGPVMAQNHFNIGWDHTSATYRGTFHFNSGSWTAVPASPLQGSRWYYAAGVFDGPSETAVSYRDGVADGSSTGIGGATGTTVDYLRFGADGQGNPAFDGVIDEVRVYHGVRSADWIAAQYLSMTDSMVSFGLIETIN